MNSTIIVILIILLHFLFYSIPPILGSFLGKHYQITLNYTYLGVVFTLVQFFDNLYAVVLTDQFNLNGGDIAYSALIFGALYLLISQPDPKVVRNLIYIFIINTIFLFLLFGMLNLVLETNYIINYLNISDEFLEFSYKSLLFSLFLITSEILLIIYLLDILTGKFKSQRLATVSLGIIYAIVIIIDGIVYPLGINLLFPGSNFSVKNGVMAKLIFGFGYGVILILLLTLSPRKLSMFIETKFPLSHYIIPPSQSNLLKQLDEAEERIEKMEKLVPICAWCKNIRDDQGYWDHVENFVKSLDTEKEMIFSHGVCPDCKEKLQNS